MKNLIPAFTLLFFAALAAIHAQPTREITVSAASSGKRLALVVGNADYASEYVADLKNTLNDADSMTVALRQLGWEVMSLKNGTLPAIEGGLKQFYQKLSAGSYEAGMFYYSGHGISVGGVNYLVPTDAQPLSENDVKYECLDANRVLSAMEGNTPVKILVLDACRNNPFSRAWKSVSNSGGLSYMDSPKGTFIGFAAAPGAMASDSRTGKNGLYTAALLQHLRTPGLSIDQVFTRAAGTTQVLAQRENWDQTPFKNSSLTAEFYFFPGPTLPQPQPESQTQTQTPPSYVPDHMVFVEGGWFEMGDVFGEGQDNEQPVHKVKVASFLIGKYEVTFSEYDLYCEVTNRSKPGSRESREDCPVINISWLEAVEYCNWRSEQAGYEKVYSIKGENVTADWDANGFRLPTEAEWEYAARQRGEKVRFGNGENIATTKQLNFIGSSKKKESYSRTGKYPFTILPVGSLSSPNRLGVHDMSGNVSEYCWDWYDPDYYAKSPSENPRGPISGEARVVRGGAWASGPEDLRAANRNSNFWVKGGWGYVGFRLARTP